MARNQSFEKRQCKRFGENEVRQYLGLTIIAIACANERSSGSVPEVPRKWCPYIEGNWYIWADW